MKNKFSIIILLAIITISLTDCSKYEKDKSYDTDLYGTYTQSIGTENSNYFSEQKFIFNEDNTYDLYLKEIQNNEVKDNHSKGKILSNETICENIIKISLDDNNILYKYKNMLGTFYKVKIPSDNKFDLVIPTPSDNWTGSYPNSAIVFDKSGVCHSCLDITNCHDTEEEHMGIYYKYIYKNDIIYFVDPSVDNMDWQILYYITDDGLFSPLLDKVEMQ